MELAPQTIPLTDKQEAFAQHFAIYRSSPQAYVHAYDVASTTEASTISTGASQLMANPKIAGRIKELQDAALSVAPVRYLLSDILVTLTNMATADPRELVELYIGSCRFCHGENHLEQWKQSEYLAALARAQSGKKGAAMPDWAGGMGYRKFRPPHPDCPECEGKGEPHTVQKDTRNLSAQGLAIYGGVKQTAHGPELIAIDRLKPLDMLIRMYGGYDDKVTHQGTLKHLGAIVHAVTAKDPHEAERLYREMVRVDMAK